MAADIAGRKTDRANVTENPNKKGGNAALTSTLRGPDLSDRPSLLPHATPDAFDQWARQIVVRWVFLPHQRPHALNELRALVAAVRAGKVPDEA